MVCPHVQDLNLRAPAVGQAVYKDDCTQCFDDTESEGGLNVCLTCFNGGCTASFPGHSKLHFELSQHPIVLNIKKRRKPLKPREDSPTKIAKLAIVAETEETLFDITTSVRCLACDGKDIPLIESNLAGVVKGVMDAMSSNKQSEVQAWEQEILPCEHTICLKQDPAKILADQELAHCANCDLNENLWLCLTCGSLGCGRQQFGGIGGNGHGLQHFDETKHPVSVKLGSITPDGTADVYCYLCNDERQDPELTDHLWHWGIKISERQKVEKSLVELQLEQNMKWEFSMSADGDNLVPLVGPGLTGLKNLGNTCYLDSVVQCLFSLSPFIERYYFEDCAMPVTTGSPSDDLETQLRKLAFGLLSGRYSVPENEGFQKGIPPVQFKKLVGKDHVEFSTMRQQDAFEYLLHLLQFMNRDSHARSKDKTQDITKKFDFVIEQRLQCANCHKVRYQTETQNAISVQVPIRKLKKESNSESEEYESITIAECLDIYTAEDKLEYTCSSCGSSAGATKKIGFRTFPKVFAMNVRRFKIVNWVPTKIDVPVEVTDNLNLDKYISKGLQDGEEILPESEEGAHKTADTFVANEGIMSVLEGMGFPTVRCEKACYYTGNSDPDAAMSWLFAHMDDPDIDEKLVIMKEIASGEDTVSEEGIAMLESMGFTAAQARKALKETGGDIERAVEWVFSHPDDTGEGDSAPETSELSASQDEDQAMEENQGFATGSYKLSSIICHKGGSVHAGHYVAFVRKRVPDLGLEWVQFNDEKVVLGGNVEEMKQFAYIYFFEHD
ncbi:uncharacterized protein V1516DRAFT_675289 [Lipomyces oligophaga]|uniref:uncharacterized protein n=1 Tax=Lipomyces oligophaga TaxID=45792 RepID=UPI0034CD9242